MAASGWFEAIWEYRYLEVYIAVASMAAALWMGVYLLRRGAGTPVGLLGGSTMLLLSLMYALEAMLGAPDITAHEYELLRRAQGVVVPFLVIAWVDLTFLLRTKGRINTAAKRVWLITGAIGASQVWLRAFTNWHYDYANILQSPFPWQEWWVPRVPGFAISTLLILVGLLWSMYNVFRAFYDEVRSVRAVLRIAQFWPPFAGILIFVLSVAYIIANYALNIGVPWLGLAGISLGIAPIAFGVFWNNTFVEEGRDISTDFIYSFLGTGAVLILYTVIIFLVHSFQHLGVELMVVIVAALVITHSLHDSAYHLLDSLLERAGISCWSTRQRLRRQVLLRTLREEKIRDALRQRLAALLEQLCLDASLNRGFVALRDVNGFIVQAVYGTTPPTSRLSSPELVCEGMIAVPFDRQLGELKGMGMIIPLKIQERQVGVLVLGEKRYDIGEISRMLVHAEAMELAIEELELTKEIRRLQRRLERMQRHKQLGADDEAGGKLLAICTSSGVSLSSAVDAITAAAGMLENYSEDPYALEVSPFVQCLRIQSQLSRIRDRSQAVAILEAEIAATIASMKPTHPQGYDWRRWTYLDRRYLHRYDDTGHRFTMEDIARTTGVSRKTLSRHHERAIRDFILAFLDPDRPSSAL